MLLVAALLLPAALRTDEVVRRLAVQKKLPKLAGDTLAGLTVAGSAVSLAAASTLPRVAGSYLALSTAGYCLRRGALHKWPGDGGAALGAYEVLRRHLEYEADWHLPGGLPVVGRLTHLAHVLCWLLIFQPLYPLLEAALYPFDLAAFWFYYPLSLIHI